MNLIGAWFLAALAVGVPLFWLLDRRWRMPAAGVAGLLWMAWLAPLSALYCLCVGLCVHMLVRVRCRYRVAQGVGLLLFASLLLFRILLADAGLGAAWVPWLGAGIFMLRAIHYLLVASRDRQAPRPWLDVLSYFFFPASLLIGPFQRLDDFEREVRRSRFDARCVSAGLERLLFGYAKVVLIASYVLELKMAEWVVTLPSGSARSYLECLQYGLSLYAKFAGYSDIAIGTGLLLGIRLPENFHHPLLARNIGVFWQRWNASVSQWCREQVSHPLYARSRSALVAALGSMLVLGLWHEVSGRYVVWALYHGAGIALWQRWRTLRGSLPAAGPRWAVVEATLAHLLTFNFVVLGFAITRSPDLCAAWRSLLTLLGA